MPGQTRSDQALNIFLVAVGSAGIGMT